MLITSDEKVRWIWNTPRFQKLAVGWVIVVASRVGHAGVVDAEEPVHRVRTRASGNAGSRLLGADKTVGGAFVDAQTGRILVERRHRNAVEPVHSVPEHVRCVPAHY